MTSLHMICGLPPPIKNPGYANVCGTYLRVIAPAQHCSFRKMLQRWRAVGDTESDLTGPKRKDSNPNSATPMTHRFRLSACCHFSIAILSLYSIILRLLLPQITSYITESLSVVSLVLTICLLARYKKRIGSDRTVIQINLSASLLCLHTILLFHDLFRMSDGLCVAAAVATHYFFLSTGK